MESGEAHTMTFGERLRRLRDAAGFSQEGLARAAGLSTSTVAKIEQRGIDPSWTTVQALARALGVEVSAFASPPAAGPATPAAEALDSPPPQRKPARRKPPESRGG
jgi:transcriptional regulator with XRE-family HTH domain